MGWGTRGEKGSSGADKMANRHGVNGGQGLKLCYSPPAHCVAKPSSVLGTGIWPSEPKGSLQFLIKPKKF